VELNQQNFILLLIFPKALLCFLSSFNPMADDYTRDSTGLWIRNVMRRTASLGRVFTCALQQGSVIF
jgi:hypothetical protein